MEKENDKEQEGKEEEMTSHYKKLSDYYLYSKYFTAWKKSSLYHKCILLNPWRTVSYFMQGSTDYRLTFMVSKFMHFKQFLWHLY